MGEASGLGGWVDEPRMESPGREKLWNNSVGQGVQQTGLRL